MKSYSWFIAYFIILLTFLLSNSGCFPDDDVKVCFPADFCPMVDAGRQEREFIVQLNPGYQIEDITETRLDSFQICFDDERNGLRIEVEDETCSSRSLVFYTGKEVFLAQLNDIAFQYNPDTTTLIDTFWIIKDCNCDERLLLIGTDLPEDVDINNGVANGNSNTEENNGPIGAIGHNFEIFKREENNIKLGDEHPTPNICFVKDTVASPPREKLTKKMAGYPSCDTVRFTPGGSGSTQKRAKIAVIDTGVDPLYWYDGASADLGQTHVFTEEASHEVPFPNIFTGGYGDTIDLSRSDDSGNCLVDDFIGYDFFHEDNNPADLKGHGTHIAHTILTADGEQGLDVRVLPLQFGGYKNDTFKCDLFSAICGIVYATKEKVDIINMSWGYYSKDTNQVLKNVVQRAADEGILMVASMGNDNVSVDECLHWPSNFSTHMSIKDEFISVAALDTFTNSPGTTYALADYSNYGLSADLAAPGTEIESALVGSKDGNIKLSGTSMAAAVVSRRAAMLMFGGNQKLSASDTKNLLLQQETLKGQDGCGGAIRFYDPTKDTTLLPAIGYTP